MPCRRTQRSTSASWLSSLSARSLETKSASMMRSTTCRRSGLSPLPTAPLSSAASVNSFWVPVPEPQQFPFGSQNGSSHFLSFYSVSETLLTSSPVLFPDEKTEVQRGQGLGYSLTARKWHSWYWNSGLLN